MAMETPPRCPPHFVRKRELTEVIGSLCVPVQVCTVELPPGHNRRGGGDATPCKVVREDRRLYFWMNSEQVSFESFDACRPTQELDVPSSIQDPRTALGWSCDYTLGHRPHERQGADPRTALFEGTPFAEALLNLAICDDVLEWLRSNVRPDLDINDDVSEIIRLIPWFLRGTGPSWRR